MMERPLYEQVKWHTFEMDKSRRCFACADGVLDLRNCTGIREGKATRNPPACAP